MKNLSLFFLVLALAGCSSTPSEIAANGSAAQTQTAMGTPAAAVVQCDLD